MCSVSTMLGVIINVNGCVPIYFACVVFLHILSFILLMLIIFMTVDAHNKVSGRKKTCSYFPIKMDTTSFFHELAPGVDNDASGVITLLAAAEALGKLKRQVSTSKF